MVKHLPFKVLQALVASAVCLGGLSASAQEVLPWSKDRQARNAQQSYESTSPPTSRYDYGQASRRPRIYSDDAASPAYPSTRRAAAPNYTPSQPGYVKPYRPPRRKTYDSAGSNRQNYGDNGQNYDDRRYGSNETSDRDYSYGGQRYGNPRNGDRRYNHRYYDQGRYDDRRYDDGPPRIPDASRETYSENEVIDAGHRFFGSLSTGLAKAIQWAFKQSGRPTGYILGEDAGGAFIAGLRYGEGKLYTKHYGVRRVFWQGPSVGYDFGGDGNRTMTLVYNLRSPRDIYNRFGGVQGAAYLVGGVSVQFLHGGDDITIAPIRTGVGVRLGANIGYLKYTRRPTWNPF